MSDWAKKWSFLFFYFFIFFMTFTDGKPQATVSFNFSPILRPRLNTTPENVRFSGDITLKSSLVFAYWTGKIAAPTTSNIYNFQSGGGLKAIAPALVQMDKTRWQDSRRYKSCVQEISCRSTPVHEAAFAARPAPWPYSATLWLAVAASAFLAPPTHFLPHSKSYHPPGRSNFPSPYLFPVHRAL